MVWCWPDQNMIGKMNWWIWNQGKATYTTLCEPGWLSIAKGKIVIKLKRTWYIKSLLSFIFLWISIKLLFYLKVKKTASTSFLSIVTLALLAKQHFWSAVLESLHVHRLVDLVVFIIHSRVKLTTDSHENKDYLTIRINEWTIHSNSKNVN